MRRVIAVAVMSSLAFACGDASIGAEPDPGSVPLPDRAPQPPDAGATPSSADAGGGGSSGGGGQHTLTVTLTGSGAGSIASDPAGLTCSGTTCTGSFATGTTVTLKPAPASGSMLSAFSGGCTGTTCAPVMSADVNVSLELVALAGAWSGTYTNTRQFQGCTFNNNGSITSTVAANAASFTGTANMTGFEIRQIPGCSLVDTRTGAAQAATFTVKDNTLTGTWSVAIQNANALDFPFTATLAGNTLTGKWTCTGCAGGFTLTKP